MSQYDTIIIGAGHNGLVCAAYLAQAGQKVIVLEARDAAGGLAAEREFHPRFRTSIAHSISHFSAQVEADLNLSAHGFQSNGIDTIGLRESGTHVTIGDDGLQGAGEADRAAYSKYASQMRRFASALAPFWEKTIPRIGTTGAADLFTFVQMGLRPARARQG